jgi:hypothetical protein
MVILLQNQLFADQEEKTWEVARTTSLIRGCFHMVIMVMDILLDSIHQHREGIRRKATHQHREGIHQHREAILLLPVIHHKATRHQGGTHNLVDTHKQVTIPAHQLHILEVQLYL